MHETRERVNDGSVLIRWQQPMEWLRWDGPAMLSRDEKPKWECVYCGSLHPDSRYACPNCGAARKRSDHVARQVPPLVADPRLQGHEIR